MKLWGRRLWTLLSGPRGRMGVSQGWAFNSWKLHSSLTGLLSATGVVSQWTQVFEERGIPEARESSEYIVAHVLGAKTFQSLKPELWTKPLTLEQLQCIQELCSHRLQRMPVQYILGEWDFQGLSLKMVPPVFIPRPETESWEIENGLWREVGLPTRWCSSLSCILNSKPLILDHYGPQFRLQELVEWVLGEVAQRPPAVGARGGPLILEVGCGSGAIALSLLSQLPESQVIAVDKEEAAVSLTRENAQRLQLQDRIRIIPLDVTSEGCWTHLMPWGPVDLVVSNPPYIFHKDMEQLAPEICSYEDPVALDGGEEGMDIISRILTLAPRLLSASGSIFLEVDPRHPELVKSWLQSRPDLHLSLVAVRKDFCGRLRFLHVQKFAP